MAIPKPLAQSVVQLYRQLIAEGCDESRLARLRNAYEFAAELHSARFRPSGRPFICHVVGTASVLAGIGADEEAVLAGLLHGVYGHGDFGDGTRGISPAKRSAVREVVGRSVEERVAAFTELDWEATPPGSRAALLDDFDDRGRAALLVRLANELDELLDFEIHFRRLADQRLAGLDAEAKEWAELARGLDQPELAQALRESATACTGASLPKVLRNPIGANHDRPPRSFVLPLRRRLSDRLAGLRARARRWASRR